MVGDESKTFLVVILYVSTSTIDTDENCSTVVLIPRYCGFYLLVQIFEANARSFPRVRFGNGFYLTLELDDRASPVFIEGLGTAIPVSHKSRLIDNRLLDVLEDSKYQNLIK